MRISGRYLLSAVALAAASAQVPPESGPAGTRVNPLPLSGRQGASGSVGVQQSPNPGGAQSVNTINSTVQVQGSFSGSVATGAASPTPIAISLADAVQRGLQNNLGTVGYAQVLRAAHAASTIERSYLLPQVSSGLQVTDQQSDLAALGFSSVHFNAPGFAFPTVIGPYHYFDLRAGVSQSLLDLSRLKNYRSSQESAKSQQFAAQDARDLVALAVTGAYLQIVSAGARVTSVKAQLDTAQATFTQTSDRHNAGVVPRIDVSRTQVELQTQRQRLSSIENDLAKQKIQLARLIGLPPGQEFTLTDSLPFAPLEGVTLDDALRRAYANRADLKAAESQVKAAEISKSAARAERMPTISVSGDYGVIGVDPTSSHGTFSVSGSVHMPIWSGRRTAGDIEQADSALEQRKAEYQDLRGQIDAQIRSAFLDLNSAADQVKVADSNRTLAAETYSQARDRFAAGVADSLEVVQAQESVASAEQDFISSVFAHNLAKAALARSMGQADLNIKQFLEKK